MDRAFPTSNLPPGVREGDPDAPWNQSSEVRCCECDRWVHVEDCTPIDEDVGLYLCAQCTPRYTCRRERAHREMAVEWSTEMENSGLCEDCRNQLDREMAEELRALGEVIV